MHSVRSVHETVKKRDQASFFSKTLTPSLIFVEFILVAIPHLIVSRDSRAPREFHSCFSFLRIHERVIAFLLFYQLPIDVEDERIKNAAGWFKVSCDL